MERYRLFVVLRSKYLEIQEGKILQVKTPLLAIPRVVRMTVPASPPSSCWLTTDMILSVLVVFTGKNKLVHESVQIPGEK